MNLRYFISSDSQFDLTAGLVRRRDLNLVYQRFLSDEFQPALVVVSGDELDTASRIYQEGGFKNVWITGVCVPQSEVDWTFMHRNGGQDVLAIIGGRQKQRCLEISYLREFAKKSSLRPAYRELTRHLKDVCSIEGMESDGAPYPKIICEPKVVDFELVESLDHEPLASGSWRPIRHRHDG